MMTGLPWGDWQFWTVSLVAVVALVFYLRPYFSRKRAPRCSNCAARLAPPPKRRGEGETSRG